MTDQEKETPESKPAAEASPAPEDAAPDGRPAAAAPEDAPDAPDAGDTGPPEAEATAPEPDAAALAAEVADLKGRLLRALAETENVRRRAANEREDVSKYAITGFARDLAPVVDNLRRALDSVPDDVRDDERLAGLVAGVEMTERELLSVLERHGIRRVDPLGEKFDHNFHQAMFEVEASDKPAGTVVEVMQVGYVIGDRLLRPAMVGVAKGSKVEPPPRVDTKV